MYLEKNQFTMNTVLTIITSLAICVLLLLLFKVVFDKNLLSPSCCFIFVLFPLYFGCRPNSATIVRCDVWKKKQIFKIFWNVVIIFLLGITLFCVGHNKKYVLRLKYKLSKELGRVVRPWLHAVYDTTSLQRPVEIAMYRVNFKLRKCFYWALIIENGQDCCWYTLRRVKAWIWWYWTIHNKYGCKTCWNVARNYDGNDSLGLQ